MRRQARRPFKRHWAADNMKLLNTYPIDVDVYAKGREFRCTIDIEVGIAKWAESQDRYDPHGETDLVTGEWTLSRLYHRCPQSRAVWERVEQRFVDQWGFLLWQEIEDEIELNPDVCEELYEVVSEDWGWDDDFEDED